MQAMARVTLFWIAWFSVISAHAQMGQIPGGTLSMGGGGGNTDEMPRHTVELSAFSLDKKEITKEQYDSCVAARTCSPAHYDDGACVAWTGQQFRAVVVPRIMALPQYPVVCVTWRQAREYCGFKGKKLPTEAQWEYAALAGRDAAYAWGNEPPDPGRCAQPRDQHPQKAGSFPPNPWGLYDMTGNVWEWVNDRFQSDYYESSEPRDPQGPDAGMYRGIRGGGWYSGKEQLRIKNRMWFEPNSAEVSIGFRCAK